MEDNIDRIDEPTVLLLNQALQNIDLGHMTAGRTFRILNDGVISQIIEKSEYVEAHFLLRYLATFFAGKRNLAPREAEKLG